MRILELSSEYIHSEYDDIYHYRYRVFEVPENSTVLSINLIRPVYYNCKLIDIDYIISFLSPKDSKKQDNKKIKICMLKETDRPTGKYITSLLVDGEMFHFFEGLIFLKDL
jgi:hypothetical protein